MPEEKQQFLVVGEVLKPFGYRGEVKIRVLSDYPNRLLKHKTVHIGPQARAYQVERARLHSGYALLKFAGYDTPESVARTDRRAVAGDVTSQDRRGVSDGE